MSRRTINIVTRLTTAEAHTLIERLDAVQDALMQSYGGEMGAMLRTAETMGVSEHTEEDDEPF